ncbi:hypothetical protein BK654_22645 [Pseudomonas brassicacearum]|nr:hypothetical protein BK653_09915 [Pseudomonas brassicacearum]ROM73431.1 hypothetical protein BK654_22645 [Pseudomonas brassicacearum]
MIIYDFYIFGAVGAPDKTDPVLTVNPDAVLAFPVAIQLLQPVSRRRAQVVEIDRSIEHAQLSFCH